MITSENKDNSVIEQACGGLASGLMEFEAGRVSVVPLIMIYIVVFATAKLNFVISVVPSERVDKALVVDSREESLLGWHWGSDS